MIEIKLVMMGFPKSEINSMSRDEIFTLLHLLDYMNRESAKGDNKEDVA
jgi:succinate dehydrogenase flavin-adding protein (antitoxin of CptAB toxin-antitoxin module)